MFRCQLTGSISEPGESQVKVVLETTCEHPARHGIAVDEYGNESEVCIDPGGPGTRILKSWVLNNHGLQLLNSLERVEFLNDPRIYNTYQLRVL